MRGKIVLDGKEMIETDEAITKSFITNPFKSLYRSLKNERKLCHSLISIFSDVFMILIMSEISRVHIAFTRQTDVPPDCLKTQSQPTPVQRPPSRAT